VETELQPTTRPLALAWLGPPLVTYAGQRFTFRTRKALALLVYLTTEARIHTREKLTTLFWPESDSTRGRGMLRTTLAYLRETLDASDTPYLVIEPQTLRFDFTHPADLDLHHIEAGLDTLRTPPEAAARGPVIRQLQQAVNCYRGDFLEGFSLADAPAFDDWASLQREVWHNRMNLLFDTLSQWQSEAGDLPAALETARRWKAHDLYGEHAPLRLMQLHFANGNRADALQVYDDYVKMLADEFGGKPAATIKALAARIRAKTPARPVREQAPRPLSPIDLPFVGREAESAQLMAAYQAASQGQTQVVLLEGEAGIGKTRLATEFLRRVTAQGAEVLAGRAFETGGELPYQPLAQLLRQPVEQEQALTDLLSPIWLAELSRLLPEVRERYPDLPQLDAADTIAQSRLLESIARLGRALADRGPLVLLIDDLQWMDLPSLDALHYALAQWTEHKTTLLLLLCSRHLTANTKHNLRPWVTHLKAQVPVTHLVLEPLTMDATLTLVASLESTHAEADLPHPKVEGQASVFQAFAQALFDETGGQPLYLVETIKSLLEQKVLIPYHSTEGAGVRWKTLTGETTGQLPLPRIIPNSVRAAILDRIARLTPAAANLLSAAAVLGQATTFSQLTAVSGLEQMAALDALEELVAKRLLVESSQAAESYLVAHDKIRDVVYDECSAIRRKVLHRRAVTALQGGDAARLAFHVQAAEMVEEMFQVSVAAGDAALHLFAANEAIAHYETARKLFVNGQALHVELDSVQHLYLNLGRALELTAQFEPAVLIYQELQALGQQRAAPAVKLAALVAAITLRLQLAETFDLVGAEEMAQEALQLARDLRDPRAEADILCGLMNCYRLSNRLPEAIHCGEQGLALAREHNLHPQTAFILSDLMRCHLFVGRLDLAHQVQEEALQLWRTLNNLPMLADSLSGSALIARWMGNYDHALASAAEAYKIGQSIANIWQQSYSQLITGAILWERGQPAQAIAVMEECLRLAEQANYLVPQILTRADLGATYGSFGDPRGFEYLYQALKLADTRLHIFRPYVIGLLARQHVLNDQLREAEALIEQAKAETNPQLRSFLFQWVSFAEAELAFRQRDFERGLTVTGEILESIRQSGMRSLLTRVLFMRGQCLVALGQPERARATLLEALADAERSGSRMRQMRILVALATIEPDPQQAAQLFQQIKAHKAYILSNSPPALRTAFLNRESASAARKAAS
jgi:DNA-binding SARP family transcriptional activator/tetratricopeptide (TPR) repeat protein